MRKIILGMVLLGTMVIANSNVLCVDSVIDSRSSNSQYANIEVCVSMKNSLDSTQYIDVKEALFANIAYVSKENMKFSDTQAHKILIKLPTNKKFKLESIKIK